jgi:excisionase family DNA binding protein
MKARGTLQKSSDDVLTPPEAAAEKGVHRNSVLKAIKHGHLAARKSGKSWIIDRASFEQWKPKAQRPQPPSNPRSFEPVASRGREKTEADRTAKSEQLRRLLDSWMADESGHDEKTWPKLKAVLEEDRLSARRLFDENTP